MELIRRGSLVLSSAPTNIPHPWKVDWARGEKFRCFLGRIYDPEVISTDEWEPERFPEGLSQGLTITKRTIQPKYLKKDRTSMNSKAYTTPVKSGSVKIYTKSAFGRVTTATAVLVDETKGCAEWDESVILAAGTTSSVYFVLHKTDSKWMVSAVLEANVLADDVKIAVVKKRDSASIKDWRLIQLWKSDLSPSVDKVEQFQVSVSGGAADGVLKVVRGAVICRATWINSYVGEYWLSHFASYPTGRLTAGATPSSKYVHDDGSVQLRNAANSGSNTWYVYIVRNPAIDDGLPMGGYMTDGRPYLCVFAGGSDAETKTTPFGGTDMITFIEVIRTKTLEISTTNSGGTTVAESLTGIASYEGLQQFNYNCQRLKVATITWDSTNNVWITTQHLIGTLTLPNHWNYNASQYFDVDTALPAWVSTPYNSTLQNNWAGAWSGYDKWTGTGTNPTAEIQI